MNELTDTYSQLFFVINNTDNLISEMILKSNLFFEQFLTVPKKL